VKLSGNSSKTTPLAGNPLRLLFIEHEPDDIEIALQELKKSNLEFEVETAATREECARKLREKAFDIVLSDYRLSGWTGMDALALIKEKRLDVPFVLVTGTLGEELAVECIKHGVTDYVLKAQLARLPVAIRQAHEAKLSREAEAHAANALRESEERYRILVENAPEAIVVLDVEKSKFVDCNENAVRLFRLSREELLRKGPGELSPPYQPDGRPSESGSRERIERVLAGGVPSFDWVHRNSQGEDIECEVHLVRLPSPAGRLVRGSIVDITDRKRAEHALRESEARYRSLVNNATYGIYWVALDGEILQANPALAQMLGYESTSELLGLRVSDTLYSNPTARSLLLTQYTKSGRADAVVEWKRKDGKIIHVRLSGRRTTDPVRMTECIEVIVENVTEKVALEKQLVQAQKFEAIGQLAGGIAHDFNNMIGAIIGWADLGTEETDAASRLHRHFEKIRQQADRAAALTRQLLAFARRQILEPRNIDLNQAVTETLSLLEKVIGCNVEIKSKLAPDLAVVCADPTQVEQVLMNLCINARDAMPQGGSLHIETGNVSFDEEYCARQPYARPGHYAVLSVTDTGTGMDATTLDRIFEPFFTTKELGKGTGLGLAMVYGIVRQHGGFVHVYSEPNVGTTFRIYFPISSQPVKTPERAQDSRPVRGGAETVLIAEDHEGLRDIARETLASLGYRVILAADGEQAVREFQNPANRIDIVLLDVVLPKLSGPEVYARICEAHPDVPVIFATGYSADIALLERARQQRSPMLQKPYSPRDLARKIRETLDEHRLVPHD
jgi:two-component system, cell cycle sensor histidine kinase and response regulator CckA